MKGETMMETELASATDEARVAAAVREATGEFLSDSQIAITRMTSNTNRVYLAEAGGHGLVVRLSGKGTDEFLARDAELHNARVAAEAGVSAEVVLADIGRGLMVTRRIPDVVTMTPALFRSRPGAPARAARVLRRMHDWPAPFQGRFDLWENLDRYGEIVRREGWGVPEGYDRLIAGARAAQAALDVHGTLDRPCHCDPVPENFLDDGTRMWLVDWEYAGTNDPFWDLGQVSMEGDFGPGQDREMLTAWLGHEPGPQHVGRLHVYKAFCNTLWTLWGLIQAINRNPVMDFDAWARERCAQAMGEMDAPDWPTHLEMIAERPHGLGACVQ